MTNTSEQFVNSTLFIHNCLKENYFGYVFFILIAGICFFISTPSHLWCFFIDFSNKRDIKETRLLLLNYTIMELIYCVECGLELLSQFSPQIPMLWHVVCFFFGLSWTGRPLLQICICIEQYVAVCHPVTFLRYKGIKYRSAATVTAWLLAFVYSVYAIYGNIFPNYFFSSVFIIALAMNSFCCVSLLCALKHPGPGDSRNQTSIVGGNQQKRNAFNTICSSLILILFTYLPQTIFIILTGVKIDDTILDCTVVPFLTTLNIFSVIITPLIKLYKESHVNCLKHQK